jgi:hypothetical protein
MHSAFAAVLAAVGAVSVIALQPGCVVEAGVSATTGIAVSGPPPPPLREGPPGPPNSPSIWVSGYWHWTGMRYTWIPGHWERAPGGARWHPPRYFYRDGTYYYEPGGWGP